MLELDSPRWSELHHAYGPADDIPPLLRQLPGAVSSAEYDAEPWFTLWSSLCHQSDVYPASFAALPHIIVGAAARSPGERAECLVLAGMIEAMRHKPTSPPLPADLELAYLKARKDAVVLTLQALELEEDEDYFRGLLGSLGAFRGFPKLGAGVVYLLQEFNCPACDALFIAPGFIHFA